MKKLTLGFCALIALGSAAFAGTEITTESKAVVPPPCPQWYADNEFNLSLSGVYGFSGDSGLLDHAWGGAIDAKYFFHRYFGLGVQGFILSTGDDDDNALARNNDDDDGVGGILGTFTLRFPINCSRFAPYIWVGGGGVWGGDDDVFVNAAGGGGGGDGVTGTGGGVVVRGDDDDAHGMGQFGAGFEIRFTPHFGMINDISWNVVSGSNNNFGMARTGLNFAF